MAGIDRARIDDERCGAPRDLHRLCRALFVLSHIDPATSIGDPEELRRRTETINWILLDAATVAPDPLATALTTLAAINAALVTATSDADRANLIIARADSAITDALTAPC